MPSLPKQGTHLSTLCDLVGNSSTCVYLDWKHKNYPSRHNTICIYVPRFTGIFVQTLCFLCICIHVVYRSIHKYDSDWWRPLVQPNLYSEKVTNTSVNDIWKTSVTFLWHFRKLSTLWVMLKFLNNKMTDPNWYQLQLDKARISYKNNDNKKYKPTFFLPDENQQGLKYVAGCHSSC